MSLQMISDDDRKILLSLARKSMEAAATGESLPSMRLKDFSTELQEDGASFVTLTVKGALRGCIGTLEPYQPLVKDVVEHAAAAAVEDYRFRPVSPKETELISIEISVLTKPVKLEYSGSEDLLSKLRPGLDGVVLKDGRMRATFLPQVWDQLPDKSEFLDHLCSKMGASPALWKIKNMEVLTYQVEEFSEK